MPKRVSTSTARRVPQGKSRPHKPTKDNNKPRAAPTHDELSDELSSDDDEQQQPPRLDDDDSESEPENPDAKRVRMAREMLDALYGDERIDQEEVGAQLEDKALREAGKWRYRSAEVLRRAAPPTVRVLRGPRLTPTCVAVSPDEAYAYCGSKDGYITQWDLAHGRRRLLRADRSGADEPRGHTRDVLALQASPDGRVLVSAGRDNTILLWDLRTMAVCKTLKGHRKAVTALAMRRDAPSAALYSGSFDRCARVHDLDQRAFVETLYGHQEGITALDAIGEDCVVSASEDRTLRMWKVAEETQLLFPNGHAASIDAVTMLTDDLFVSGSQDGSIALWNEKRKRAVATRARAHGESRWGGACWISAATAPTFSDVAITGSCDGQLRFWHCDVENKAIEQVMAVPVVGFVNGLAVATSGKFVAAAVGQEHRLGRWFCVPEARNSLCIVPLPPELHRAPRSMLQQQRVASVAVQPAGGVMAESSLPSFEDVDFASESD